jgi:hypothetical protein
VSKTEVINPSSLSIDMTRLGKSIRAAITSSEKPVRVKVSEYKETIHDRQNILMWRWHGEFVKYRYESAGEVFTVEDWHEVFKVLYIGTSDPVKIMGKWQITPKSTKDLSVTSFAKVLTQYRDRCARLGCKLISSDDKAL